MDIDENKRMYEGIKIYKNKVWKLIDSGDYDTARNEVENVLARFAESIEKIINNGPGGYELTNKALKNFYTNVVLLKNALAENDKNAVHSLLRKLDEYTRFASSGLEEMIKQQEKGNGNNSL